MGAFFKMSSFVFSLSLSVSLFLSPLYIILPFPTIHGVLKVRILKWFAILFSSGPHSVRPLHDDPPVLGLVSLNVNFDLRLRIRELIRSLYK